MKTDNRHDLFVHGAAPERQNKVTLMSHAFTHGFVQIFPEFKKSAKAKKSFQSQSTRFFCFSFMLH